MHVVKAATGTRASHAPSMPISPPFGVWAWTMSGRTLRSQRHTRADGEVAQPRDAPRHLQAVNPDTLARAQTVSSSPGEESAHTSTPRAFRYPTCPLKKVSDPGTVVT